MGMTLLDIERLKAAVAPEVAPFEPIWGCYIVSMRTLQFFLGQKWVTSNILDAKNPQDYLRTGGITDWDNRLFLTRIIILAELFLNLQRIPNFPGVVARIREDRRARCLEDVIAELTFAKLLILDQIPFQFISAGESKAPDIEIMVDGLRVFCEVKCKRETTAVGVETLKNSLTNIRHQLPEREFGMVAFGLPNIWMSKPENLVLLDEAAAWAFRKTERLALLIFFSEELIVLEDGMPVATLYREYRSPRAPMAERLPRTLLSPVGLTRRPPHWISVLDLLPEEIAAMAGEDRHFNGGG